MNKFEVLKILKVCLIDKVVQNLIRYSGLSQIFLLPLHLVLLETLAQEFVENFIEQNLFVSNVIVPLAFYVVICTASDKESYLGPFVCIPFLQNKKEPVLFYGPNSFF